MAITINSQPTGTLPVYNDNIFIVQSDKRTEANFKYIADVYVYVDGVSTNVHRMSVPPHPTLGVGVFNPSRIIENYISGNFDLNLTGVDRCYDGATYCALVFGEEYGLSSSGTTVYTGLATSNTSTYFCGVFDWEDFCDYDYTIHRSNNSSSKFLTNSPANKVVYQNEYEYLYAINRTSGDIYYYEVRTSDVDGNLLGVYKIYNQYQSVANSFNKMVRCPVGWNMNNITAGDITIAGGTYASLPILFSSVYSYTVKCIKYDGTQTIGTKTYRLDTTCERYTKYRLHFQNKLGGYDSFSFTKKSNVKSDIVRENYKSNLGELTDASTYTHSKSQRAITQYSTKIEDTVKVTSDWLSSGDVAWLEELVTSPDVYVEKNGSAVPINIITASYDRQNGEDKKMFNLSLEFKFSYKRYRQRF